MALPREKAVHLLRLLLFEEWEKVAEGRMRALQTFMRAFSRYSFGGAPN